jgi:hypothetical protein
MEELRSEVRSAFDKEQAAHPPAAALRRNVVNAVTAHARPAPNLQWLAVAAAVLLGLAVVAGLMSSRLTHRATVPGHPVADYGPPPAGVSLIYVQDPKHPSWLIGFDWTGKPQGTVKLGQPIDAIGTLGQSPDGSAFGYSPNGKGGYQQFLDRVGRPIEDRQSSLFYPDQMWADDSRRLCTLDFPSQQWTLGLRTPGAAPSSISVVALDPNIVRSGIIGITFAACSARNDRAILTRIYPGIPSQLWVVRISDGKILSHHTYPDMLLANVVASADAAYIAENTFDTVRVGAPFRPGVTRIRRVSDWAQVATAGTSAVRAFSGDDSLVLVTASLLTELPPGLRVIDWRSGSALWRYQGTEALGGFIAEPGGRSFALALTAPNQIQASLRDVVIVHGDGSTNAIPGRFVPLW